MQQLLLVSHSHSQVNQLACVLRVIGSKHVQLAVDVKWDLMKVQLNDEIFSVSLIARGV